MRYLLFLFILIITSLQANNLKKITLQLSWLHQFQFAGYYIAKEKGYYKDIGIDLEIREYKFGLNLSEEIENKKADFAVGRSSLIIDKSEGKDIVALAAIFQNSPLILLLRKDSNIKNIEDLKNKNIMITNDAKTSASIISMLSANGISTKDINIQKHSFNLDDLINKKTDAMASYISNEPVRLDENFIEYTIFNPRDYGFQFYDDILFTSSKFIKENPELTKQFFNATLKGWKYAFENKVEVAELIKEKYNSQNKSLLHLIKEGEILKKLVYDHNHDFIGCIEKDVLSKIKEIYKVLGLIKNDVDLDDFIYENNPHKYVKFNLTKNEIQLAIFFLIILLLLLGAISIQLFKKKKWINTVSKLEKELIENSKEIKNLKNEMEKKTSSNKNIKST